MMSNQFNIKAKINKCVFNFSVALTNIVTMVGLVFKQSIIKFKGHVNTLLVLLLRSNSMIRFNKALAKTRLIFTARAIPTEIFARSTGTFNKILLMRSTSKIKFVNLYKNDSMKMSELIGLKMSDLVGVKMSNLGRSAPVYTKMILVNNARASSKIKFNSSCDTELISTAEHIGGGEP